ncbi:YceH family protein [Alteromonas gracilis]|uniref:YceH family protein n=1 Tax=Alteromonas gracilis TaxID=1479524 RepID=UPI0030D38967
MNLQLTEHQCRVIGVLLEKEVTTPDQYPLSLNALTNGCNQKSNREPVMSLSEGYVQNTIDELVALKLVDDEGVFSGRVPKYKHRFCNTEFGSFKLTAQQKAIICVLLLRGPQTPGELRNRTNRLAEFSNVTEVENCLAELDNLNGDQVVIKLEREPGKRESRYAHLFSGKDFALEEVTKSSTAPSDYHQDQDRLSALEQRVERLEALLDEFLK